ncbi:MAG TPA: Nif3-like dinuclear metal center hexameric protein [Aggregatilineales bacterium]|nr:Nif3-like dinuclear metal center hexameric protein [Aggregatilineales bacterium]
MIKQAELVARLDTFFNVAAFDESSGRRFFPAGYESMFEHFAAPGFLTGSWNGLMLDNAKDLDRVYLIVFPAQSVLDEIIAREVERGAPGAMIFCHHVCDYRESGPGFVPMPEVQLEELKEHHISYYVCHAPLDVNKEISTASALADMLKLGDQERFVSYMGGFAGLHGKINAMGFNDFARRVAEATALPLLRYDAIRHNGRPVQHVAVVTGGRAEPEVIREAANLGCDTFVAGEWWLFGPGEWRVSHREEARILLTDSSINLIGTSHYASEAVVMRAVMPDWFYGFTPGVEPIFVGQADPWR